MDKTTYNYNFPAYAVDSDVDFTEQVAKIDLPSWWPKYSDGEPIMPGDHVIHPDMHGVNTITDVVYGIHGASVCCYGGFKTMAYELFTKKEIS